MLRQTIEQAYMDGSPWKALHIVEACLRRWHLNEDVKELGAADLEEKCFRPVSSQCETLSNSLWDHRLAFHMHENNLQCSPPKPRPILMTPTDFDLASLGWGLEICILWNGGAFLFSQVSHFGNHYLNQNQSALQICWVSFSLCLNISSNGKLSTIWESSFHKIFITFN